MLPIEIKKIYQILSDNHRVFIINQYSEIESIGLDETELIFLKNTFKSDVASFAQLFKNGFHHFFIWLPKLDHSPKMIESVRLAGAELKITNLEIDSLTISNLTAFKVSLFFAEGLVLSNYKFDKFISKKTPKNIDIILIDDNLVTEAEIEMLNTLNQAVYINRDLINEPQFTLGTKAFVEIIQKISDEVGVKMEVFNKKKIQSLKMGGLLAVNQGSFTDPAFISLQWNSPLAINTKPLVLVGKGVMFDTGGLNIKTGNYMNDMHMDMAGASTAFTTIFAIAKSKLPINIIALLPITDNRPGNNAFVPGDIITMANGMTVEIVNTDAEGRLILADALVYAQKFHPQLVIDLATLTGSAARAIGRYAAVAMHNAEFFEYDLISMAGEDSYERLVEFPLWDEYSETLKSDFADIKNLGGTDAGAITAGKFLENFVDFPWLHIDIAGPAILASKYGYQTKGASGFGTRLLFNFVQKYIKTQL
jgi:leucyl aminopeptidase